MRRENVKDNKYVNGKCVGFPCLWKSYDNIVDIQLLEIKPQWRKLQSMARPHLIDSFYGPTKLVKAWESIQV